MVARKLDYFAAPVPRCRGWNCGRPAARLGAAAKIATATVATISTLGETDMPTVTWDHVHLRSPDPEATAAWLADILGGEIIRGPGRIDVKLGGASVFIAPVAAGDALPGPRSFRTDGEGHRRRRRRDQGQGRRVHQAADHDPAGRAHLLHPRTAGHFHRAAGARQEIRLTRRCIFSVRTSTGRHTPRTRSIQYAVTSQPNRWRLWILDHPLEPVIGRPFGRPVGG